jgi:hypothetical protein
VPSLVFKASRSLYARSRFIDGLQLAPLRGMNAKTLITLGLAAWVTGAFAQDRAPPPTHPDPVARVKQAQQDRMLLCNQQATRQNLKGRDHRAFVSQCLSGDSSVGASSKQPAPEASARR